MNAGLKSRRRTTRRLLAGGVLAAGALAITSVPASAATTAIFSGGVLTVTGDSLANNITVSRDAAGRILVNGGAVSPLGGPPPGAHTSPVPAPGQGGDDAITPPETKRAPPPAHPFGGAGSD